MKIARRYGRSLKVTVFLLLVAGVIGISGCDRQDGGDTGGAGGSTEETRQADPGAVAAPGIYELADGRVEAVGTLAYLELEGGFWAVLDVEDGAEPSPEREAGIVAVIPNAEDVRPDVESLRGEYVAVRGRRLEGPSMRMAGAEIEADTIEVVGGDVIE